MMSSNDISRVNVSSNYGVQSFKPFITDSNTAHKSVTQPSVIVGTSESANTGPARISTSKRPASNRLDSYTAVHEAFFEFRAKESDKCLSAQCLYCNSIRAKNTSRQRAHLMECPQYQAAVKEHDPRDPLLDTTTDQSGGQEQPRTIAHDQQTPSQNQKKRLLSPDGERTPARTGKKREHGLVSHTKPKASGDLSTSKTLSALTPELERDLQIRLLANPRILIRKDVSSEVSWLGFISGSWVSKWGRGTVLPGGHEEHMLSPDCSTKIKGVFVLQTDELSPAYIQVKMKGSRSDSSGTTEKINGPLIADCVDQSIYSLRLSISMTSGDPRFEDLSRVMWIACGQRQGSELTLDVYRVT